MDVGDSEMEGDGQEEAVVPLTDTENEKGVGEFKWSPDGMSIAFLSADEKSAERKKRDEEKDDAKVYGEDWEYNRLRIVDVKTKKVTTVVQEDAHITGFDWSEDGTRIVLKEYKTPQMDDIFTGTTIKIVNVESGQLETVVDSDAALGLLDNLTWFGKWIWWSGEFGGKSGQASRAIFRVEIDKKDAQVERVAYGETNCATALGVCGDELLAYVIEGLSDSLRTVGGKKIYFKDDIDIGHGWDALVKNGMTTVVVVKAPDTALPLEVFSIVDGVQTQVSNHGQQLADFQLGRTTNLYCNASDGTPLDGVLSVPSKSEGKEPHATVVCPHGGPYGRVTRGSNPFFSFTEWFLSLGYAVLLPNYRGGMGRGDSFAQTVVGNIGVSYSDIIDLLKQAIADGVVDEKRVAIAGWSQGGFLSYLAPTQTLFHFAAAIPGAGISSWETMCMTSDIPTVEGLFAGSFPWLSEMTNFEARRWSPIYHMQNIKTPHLILHGEKDPRVPVEQAVGFHRGMMARGKECEIVIYPREGHGFPVGFERTHYIHMLNKMKDFLGKHLR